VSREHRKRLRRHQCNTIFQAPLSTYHGAPSNRFSWVSFTLLDVRHYSRRTLELTGREELYQAFKLSDESQADSAPVE
jgi:hypothetical protein